MKKLLEFYKKLKPRERKVFFAAAAVLGIFLTDRVVVGPAMQAMSAIDRSIREEEDAIRKSVYVLNKKVKIQSESKELSIYVSEAKDPEEEMTSLLKILESLTNQAGVNLVYVKPGTIKEAPGLKKFYASLECESEMEQVATLFHTIESSPKLLKIEKYEIEPKSKDSSLARCAMTVSKTALS